MLKKLVTLFIIGFSTVAGAKSILDQIKEDDLKVAIDYSAIINKQLVMEDICQSSYTPTKYNSSGIPVKMLGYAHVYMGAGPNVSKFGHLGERFVYCIGNELQDMYYDGIKLTKEAIPLFESDYPDARKEYINSKKVLNSLYYRKIQNPTQINLYGTDTVRNNRNIYEQWLDINEKEMLDLLVRNINRVAKQALQVAKEEKLAAFRGLLNNCTYEVTEDLQSIPTLKSIKIETVAENNFSDAVMPESKNYVSLSEYLNSVIPKSVYKSLTEGRVTKLLVIYPSQENMRKIFFQKTSFIQSIKLLEVPLMSFNPKFAPNWSQDEINRLTTELADYHSPLAMFFMERIKF